MKIQFGYLVSLSPEEDFQTSLILPAWNEVKAELTADFETLFGTEIAQKYL